MGSIAMAWQLCLEDFSEFSQDHLRGKANILGTSNKVYQPIRAAIVAIITLVVSLTVSPAAFARPPFEAFAKLPLYTDVILSPDGGRLAAIQNVDGKPRLLMINFNPGPGEESSKSLPLDLTEDNAEAKVIDLMWLNDERVGVAVMFENESILFLGEFAETRLLSIPVDLSEIRLIPEQRVTGAVRQSQIQHNIIDYLRDETDYVLMAMDPTGIGQEHNVYRVHVRTGKVARVEKSDGFTSGWRVDHTGRVRLKTEHKEKTRRTMYRLSDSNAWQALSTQEVSSYSSFHVMGISDDLDVAYVVIPNDKGIDELFTYDLRTKTLGGKVLAFEGIGVGGLRRDRFTRKYIGASYAEHYPAYYYFDEELAELKESVDQVFPKTNNRLVTWDRTRTRFLVYATSPQHPGTYYLLDRGQGGVVKLLNTYEYDFKESELSPVEPVTYQARDGLEIPGYLTLPHGPSNRPRPMVVLPHGGPTARDYLGFDYWAQLIASRGIVVLQPNFRGSSGYGTAFRNAGTGEWGLSMQDDITDGVQAMIDRGIADPDKICIFGWSYGGYAALMGAIKTPDLSSVLSAARR